jgi:hypothetical protein
VGLSWGNCSRCGRAVSAAHDAWPQMNRRLST